MNPIFRLPALALGLASIAGSLALQADELIPKWQVAPGDREYVETGNLLRGIAYDPVGKYVAITPRQGSPKVILLDAATGADGSEDPNLGVPRTLSFADANGDTILSGGTFTLNLIGAGTDGALYACNLATSAAQPVRIYRWAKADVAEPVSLAYGGTAATDLGLVAGTPNDVRFGDAFAVRGAGTSTELLLSSRTGKYLLVFRTTDGVNFTPTAYTTDLASGTAGLGLAWGPGNTVFTDINTSNLRRLELVEATKTARTLTTYATGIVPLSSANIATDAAAKRLAAVDIAAHNVRVYDISDPAAPVQIGSPLPFPAANGNGNGTGAAAFSDDTLFALETNNGLLAALIQIQLTAPSVATQPTGGSPYVGTSFSLSVGAQGSAPLSYQWLRDDAPVAGATQSSLNLTSLTTNQSGAYAVIISNGAGSITSNPANLFVREPFTTSVLTSAWRILAGERDTLNTDSTQRGLAFNPVSGNLLYVSRSGGNFVVVLDPATGAEKHRLTTTDGDGINVVAGGTLPANMIGVAEDGAVYLSNLNLPVAGSGAILRVYRWESDAPDAGPTVIEVAELPADVRFGDTFAVRGRGDSTELLYGSRSANSFAVVNVTGGTTATTKVYTADGVANGAFGLGVAFGPGNSVFGTASGSPIVHVAFDPASGSATLARTYGAGLIPTSVAHLAFDATRNLLVGTALETPDNVLLYSLADIETPVLLDQELFPVDNPNVNGTGALAFGGNRVFALDSNQGVFAYTLDLSTKVRTTVAATLNGANIVITVADPGTYDIESGSTLGTWTKVGTATTAQPFTAPASSAAAFYRAVAR
jgi:hypothetical protein